MSYVTVLRVNDTSLNISWGEADPPNGNITSYTVWVNSTSEDQKSSITDPSIRTQIVDIISKPYGAISHYRLFIIFLDETYYKVCVVAVNEAGQGECEIVEMVISQPLPPKDKVEGES